MDEKIDEQTWYCLLTSPPTKRIFMSKTYLANSLGIYKSRIEKRHDKRNIVFRKQEIT